MQGLPLASAQAASAGQQPQSIGVAARPLADLAASCSTTNAPAIVNCLPDGAGGFGGISVTHNGVVTTEPTSDAGGLTAHLGDTITVPFAISVSAPPVSPGCATMTSVNPQLVINPNQQDGNGKRYITTVDAGFLPHWPSKPSGNLMNDGNTLPTLGGTDTVYGTYTFTVLDTDTISDNASPTPHNYIEVLQEVPAVCGSLGGKDQYWIDSSRNPARRIQIVGAAFTATASGPTAVAENNSVILNFTISNATGPTTAFTIDPLTITVTPTDASGSAIPVTSVSVTYPSGIVITGQYAGSLNTGQTATGTITVGPFPTTYADNATVSLVVSGKAASDPIASTQTVTWPLTVKHARMAVTKTTTTTLAKPGDPINYAIQVINIGQLPLTNLQVTDSLTGTLTGQTSLAPGASTNFPTTYTVRDADSNPLTNTVNVAADWVPAAPDIGPTVRVTAQTSHLVQIASANLDLQFKTPSAPTMPNYAKPGVPITGVLTLGNSGTDDVINITGTVQLIDQKTGTVVGTGTINNLTPSGLGIVKAGTTVTPNPDFTVTLPGTATGLTQVNLVIIVNGVSAKNSGQVVHRQLSVPLDVVYSNLHVIVTSDASSTGLVGRGQTINYTVRVQNISNAPQTGIVIASDSLSLLGGTVTVPDLPKFDNGASDTYTLARTLPYTVNANTPSTFSEVVTVTFSGSSGTTTATGQLTLNIADVQATVSVIADCLVVALTDTTCTGANIFNNQTQAPNNVRYKVLIQNVTSTTLTNILACPGNVVCPSGSPNLISLTYPTQTNTLFALESATGYFNVALPSATTTPFVQGVTVTVNDQFGQQVTFRGASSLNVVSPNAYWTVTKTASVTTAFVGDTITYTVKACYTPNSSGRAGNVNGCKRQRSIHQRRSLVPTLTVTNSTGTTVGTPGKSVDLPQNDCAAGTYTYVADDTKLLEQPGPIDLTNTVIFTSTSGGVPTATAFATVKLSNPIQVFKTVSPAGTVDAGTTITYTYKFVNQSANTFTVTSIVDNVLGTAPFTASPITTLAPGAALPPITYQVLAPAAGAAGIGLFNASRNVANTVTVTGTFSGVSDLATANAKITVNPPLVVTKTVDNFAPFYYDPPLIYTVTITNTTSNPITLDGASDSLGSVATPVVDGTIKVAVTTTSSGAAVGTFPLANLVLASNQTATLSYKASPGELLKIVNDGAYKYKNTFTINAHIGTNATTGAFTETASTEITIYQPLGALLCPDLTTNYTYFGWGETTNWVLYLANASVSPKGKVISNIAITGVTGLDGHSGINIPPGTVLTESER